MSADNSNLRGQVAIEGTSFPARHLRGQVAIETASRSAGNLRGQVATEFLLYTAVFMFVAVAAFIVLNDVQSSELPLQQNKVAKETGDGFVNTLTLAIKGGEGFSYNYSFPRTVLGIPYKIDLRGLESGQGFIMMEWPGSFANFTYRYSMPRYKYKFEGACLDARVLISDACSNTLTLYNDGENLTIKQQMP